MNNSILKSDDNNISDSDNNISDLEKNLIDTIANNVPQGLTKLCGNVQTILIATFVPTIVSVIVSMTDSRENELATFILTITLIIISISLILFSFLIYKASGKNINKYFIVLYLGYSLFGFFALSKGVGILDIFNISPTYIKNTSSLLRFILATLILSTFVFSIFNLNYSLYTNKCENIK
jgi:ABC-type proline/glycine betaine transport system permease subunit